VATGLGVACTAIVTGPAAALAGEASADAVPSVAASITGGRSALDHRSLMKRFITSPFRAVITVVLQTVGRPAELSLQRPESVVGAESLELSGLTAERLTCSEGDRFTRAVDFQGRPPESVLAGQCSAPSRIGIRGDLAGA
jgi:hypothetical protein